MQNWKDTPLPKLMRNLPRDPRGLPVPFVVLQDQNGKYHFKVNDTMKQLECYDKHLCSICGTHMESNDRWLIGGIASAFDKHGVYVDSPVHKSCGTYALMVCPYLSIRQYNGKIDMLKMAESLPNMALYNHTVDEDRLPLFAFVRIVAYTFKNEYLVPIKPFADVQLWRDGQRIYNRETRNLLTGTKWEKYLDEIKTYQRYILFSNTEILSHED